MKIADSAANGQDAEADVRLLGPVLTAKGQPLAVARFAAFGVILVAIGSLLGLATAGDRTFPADLAILAAMQRPGWAGFDWLAWAASRCGDAFPALLLVSLCAAVACAAQKRVDLALSVLLASALRAIGPALKSLFESQRPPIDVASLAEHVDAFGYPSGHAFGAALVYGMVAIVIPWAFPGTLAGKIVRVLATGMVVLIPLARVRLGVHWPSDVAGGLAFGFGFVCLLLAGLGLFERRHVRT